MPTIEFNGTGGLMEGDFGTADIDVNMDAALFADPTAGASYDKPYVYINISESSEAQQAFFKKFPNVNKVPQISLDDGFHIGGYNELRTWLNRIA